MIHNLSLSCIMIYYLSILFIPLYCNFSGNYKSKIILNFILPCTIHRQIYYLEHFSCHIICIIDEFKPRSVPCHKSQNFLFYVISYPGPGVVAIVIHYYITFIQSIQYMFKLHETVYCILYTKLSKCWAGRYYLFLKITGRRQRTHHR